MQVMLLKEEWTDFVFLLFVFVVFNSCFVLCGLLESR